MSCERSSALVYLATGLVHRFGNTLFAVHGRARLLRAGLDEPSPPLALLLEDARAVVDDADAAMRALIVMRWLTTTEPAELVRFAAFVEDVLDVARVPLRDAGVVLRSELSADLADALVQPVDAIGPLATSLATLGAAARDSETTLCLRGMRSGDFAELRFEPEPRPATSPEAAAHAARCVLAIHLHHQP